MKLKDVKPLSHIVYGGKRLFLSDVLTEGLYRTQYKCVSPTGMVFMLDGNDEVELIEEQPDAK